MKMCEVLPLTHAEMQASQSVAYKVTTLIAKKATSD